jgi:P27 family predicted phage terminase small subunit
LKFVGPATAATRPQRRVRKGHPERPPELTGEAAAEWDRLAPELDAAGLLAVTDRGILAAYCLAYQTMLACRNAISASGYFLETPIQNATGAIIGVKCIEHPAVGRLAESSRRVATLAADLGLTPAARDRMEGGAPAGESTGPGNRVVALRDRIQAARNGG